VTLEFRFTTTTAPAPSEGPELPTTSFHYRTDPREGFPGAWWRPMLANMDAGINRAVTGGVAGRAR
jgi:hypothetical protein